jgi:hypothetical protein
MKKALLDVLEFHKAYNLPIPDSKDIPDKKRVELRLSLIREEAQELKEALAANDMVEVADALADLRYVILGCAIECGLSEDVRPAMPKSIFGNHVYSGAGIPSSETLKILEQELYVAIHGLTYFFEIDDLYGVNMNLCFLVDCVQNYVYACGLHDKFEDCHNEVQRSNMSKLDENGKPIYRAEDGKVLKGPNFSPPNLRKILYNE